MNGLCYIPQWGLEGKHVGRNVEDFGYDDLGKNRSRMDEIRNEFINEEKKP
jgi:uncharacterized protein (DUF1499 family)